MTTELARPSDLPAILKMIRALSAFHEDTATVTLERLQSAFFGPAATSFALVARQKTDLVGYAGVNRTIALHTGVPRFDIHHLYVKDGFRAAGIGKALIAHTRDVATEQGAVGLTIGTDPHNKTAQSAYRAMGLKEITDAGPRFWIPCNET